ncbi:MAG: hypothetical protein ACRC26_05430 [Bacteroidales bacterium]
MNTILKMFVSPERSDLNNPFREGEFVYATNGNDMFVRIKSDTNDFTVHPKYSCSEYFKAEGKQEKKYIGIDSLNKYLEEFPLINIDGELQPDPNFSFKMEGKAISYTQLKVIRDLIIKIEERGILLILTENKPQLYFKEKNVEIVFFPQIGYPF